MIILAAGQGTRLRPLTDNCPKCMVQLSGRSLLDWQLETAHAAGCHEVIVVGGYFANQLRRPGVQVVVNEDYDCTNMVHSLFCAEEFFDDGFVLSYGDIVYQHEILESVIQSPLPIAVAIDSGWHDYWEDRFDDPLSDAESLQIGGDGSLQNIGQSVSDIDQIQGQYIGLMAFRDDGVRRLKAAYQTARQMDRDGLNPFGTTRSLAGLYMTDLLQGMIDRGDSVWPVWIDRGWYEIDSLNDLRIAEAGWNSCLVRKQTSGRNK